MYSYTEQVASKLNGLLKKSYDAEKGYRTLSENAQGNVLTNFFERKANERKDFGRELRREIRAFGEDPEKNGSFTGVAHRAWINTKSLISVDSDEAMLEEALRGEKAAIKEYNDVINSEEHLPQGITNVLKSQRNSILHDATNIKALEDVK